MLLPTKNKFLIGGIMFLNKISNYIKFIKLGLITSSLIIGFSSQYSYSALTIEINKGVYKPYPIVMLPFSKTGASKLSQVIKADLEKSGRFNFKSGSNYKFVQNPKDMPWKSWPNLEKKADFILQGDIKPAPTGDKVQYAVFNTQNYKVLKAQVFNNIKDNNIRALGHHIADKVYQSVTGIPGYFSSKIAYVLVEHARENNSRKLIYKLIIADSDGENPHVLVKQERNPIATPTFSPDKKQIAYVSYVKNTMAIYTIELSTGKRKIIANFPGINSAPSFSPDGKIIAMGLSDKKDKSKVDLYLYNIKNKKFTRLTRVGTNTSPKFSKDGRNLLFTSNRSGRVQIYKMNLASKRVSQITDIAQGVQNFDAQFLPDNKRVVMMNQMESGGAIRIVVLNLLNKRMEIISAGPTDKSPALSSNGQMVLYINLSPSGSKLMISSVDSRASYQLPVQTGAIRSPAWI